MAVGGNFGGPEVDDSIFPAKILHRLCQSVGIMKVYQKKLISFNKLLSSPHEK